MHRQAYRDSRKQLRSRARADADAPRRDGHRCTSMHIRARMHHTITTVAHTLFDAPRTRFADTWCSSRLTVITVQLALSYAEFDRVRDLLVTVRAVGSFRATVRFFPRGKSLLEFAMENAARRRNGCLAYANVEVKSKHREGETACGLTPYLHRGIKSMGMLLRRQSPVQLEFAPLWKAIQTPTYVRGFLCTPIAEKARLRSRDTTQNAQPSDFRRSSEIHLRLRQRYSYVHNYKRIIYVFK